jgi:branched chain amino acid efflux pump
MPERFYIASALGVAVSITVALRTIPFVAKSAVKDSPLLADLGRWMPLGPSRSSPCTACLSSM